MSIVTKLTIRRDDIDYTVPEISEALDEIMGISNFRLPLAPEYVELILKGINSSIFNAMRRTLLDEMMHYALNFQHEDFVITTTTDSFMIDYSFINGRIRNIKLIPHLPEDLIAKLKFEINVMNDTDDVMTVYAKDMIVSNGKLPYSIFNPTFEIAFIQPGKSLHIRNIRIETGKGNYNAVYNTTCRNGGKPLDLEEYGDEEINGPDHPQRVLSGFKLNTSIAKPTKYRLNFYAPATPDNDGKTSTLLIIDACSNIISRLRFIQRNIEDDAAPTGSINFVNTEVVITPFEKGGGGSKASSITMQKYVINVKNETDTIGGLLARTICEMVPDISLCVYSCIDHKKTMTLTVRNPVSDPSELEHLVIKAIKHIISTFTTIKEDVQKLLRR